MSRDTEVRFRVELRSAFNGVSAPKYKGRNDVRLSNLQLAADARKAEKVWRRSLRKGQR